jgi:D-galactarolactone isomerase
MPSTLVGCIAGGAVTDEVFPAGSCDTHMHFYDHRFPVAPTAHLQPPDATVADYRAVQAELGTSRVVVVQPSTYGLDNACQLDAVAQLGDNARLVAVVDEQVTDAELAQLTQVGARGARFFMLPGGAVPWEIMPVVARCIAPFDWHIQLQMNGRFLYQRAGELAALPVPIVVDHVGRFMPSVVVGDMQFDALLRLIDTGTCWVKLSAPYETELDPSRRYEAVTELVHALVRHAPQRLLWATNWPHPGQLDPPGLHDLRRLLLDWIPNAATRRQILVDNPAELYGFS